MQYHIVSVSGSPLIFEPLDASEKFFDVSFLDPHEGKILLGTFSRSSLESVVAMMQEQQKKLEGGTHEPL